MITRRTLLMLTAAGFGTLAAGLLVRPPQALRDAPAPGSLVFPGLAQSLGRAATLEFRKQDQILVLRRQGETWLLPAKSDYPARADRVRETLTGLTELRLV